MMMKSKKNVLIVLIIAILALGVPAHAGQIRVSVAKSMTDLFKNMIETYTRLHPDVTIQPNFASSGALAKQINQGAPADLYVSANPKWMKFLVENGKIDSPTKKVFAHNSLVFVGKSETNASSLEDLKNLKKISLGSPGSVPAGQYAKQALDKAGLYDELLKSGRLVMAKDVRQALIYADRGETDGAFVYKTDAMLAVNAKILFEVPQGFYNQVTYPIAITKTGAGNEEVQDFYNFVTSDAVHDAMTHLGFTLP